MLSLNFCSKLIQLPLNKIKIIKEEVNNEGDVLTLQIKRRTKYCKCPYCKQKTKKKHNHMVHIQKKVRHICNFKYHLNLELQKRRFYCSKCKKDFHEQYEFVPFKLQKDKRVRSKSHTKTFEEYVLFEWASTTIAEIARRCDVSEYRLWKIIDELDLEKLRRRGIKYMEDHEGDLFLGIDEHSFSGRDMVLVITEHSTKKVVAVLKDIKKQTLKDWLKELPPKVLIRIKGLTVDMTNNYKRTVLTHLGAHVVDIVDKFHVIQQANKVFDQVRQLNNWMIHTGYYGNEIIDLEQKKAVKKTEKKQRLHMNEKTSDTKYRSLEIEKLALEKGTRPYLPDSPKYKPITLEHYISEKYRTLFLVGEEKLTQNQQHRINQILIEFDPENYMFEAYNTKEKIRECLHNKDSDLLDEIISDLEQSKHYQLKTFCNTLKTQKQAILNYFKYGLTNARCEGKNNKAKVLKRISYGYNTKKNYMKKLLFAL